MNLIYIIQIGKKMPDNSKIIPELNFKVISIGIILSIVMGAANVYLGLKVGMTVSASIPASVMGMLVIKYINKLFKPTNSNTILEANQIQTAASAGESLAAGIIFTMPALIIIGAWQEFNMLLTTAIAFTGGLLGILFMIPMRQVFIVKNRDNLKYPEGLACAEVLKAGQKDDKSNSAKMIVNGAIIGALFKFFISFLGIIKDSIEHAIIVGNRILFWGADISPALLAVGYIVRLNIAILIFIGGFLGWIIGIPILGEGYQYSNDPISGAWSLWSSKIRYVGVGAMVIGGIFSIIKVKKGLIDAIKILFTKSKNKNILKNERNIHPTIINTLSLIAILLVGYIYYTITNNFSISIAMSIIMILMAFFFTAVASYIVGLVGNSNSPVSGMTITAVLFTGGLLYILGFSGTEGIIATLGVAAIVCCAACTSGDVCNDLKTGYIVGATPYKQQIMQIIGVAFSAIIMAPVLQLLHENTIGGIGGKELPAPQATLFANLANGFFGDAILPWDMIQIGALIGIIILFFDFKLEKNKSEFRLHLMPIAVGIYLPFGLSIPILIGGLLSHLILQKNKTEKSDSLLQKGVLLSSGLIAGESLMGIFLAFMVSLGIVNIHISISSEISTILTVFSCLLTIYWFFTKSKTI